MVFAGSLLPGFASVLAWHIMTVLNKIYEYGFERFIQFLARIFLGNSSQWYGAERFEWYGNYLIYIKDATVAYGNPNDDLSK